MPSSEARHSPHTRQLSCLKHPLAPPGPSYRELPPLPNRRMIELTVNNMTGAATSQSPTSFTVNGDFPTLTAIKDAILAETGIEKQEQLLLHEGRLMFGDEEDISIRFNLQASPAITLHRRLPGSENITVVIRPAPGRSPIVFFHLRAEEPVLVLKNYLARSFCLAPWKQVLVALEAPMLGDEPISSYATSTTVEVSFSELSDGPEPQPPCIIVEDQGISRAVTVAVERRDTVDVLLSHLEAARMIRVGENPRIFRGDEQLVSAGGKSFEDDGLDDWCFLDLVRDGNRSCRP